MNVREPLGCFRRAISRSWWWRRWSRPRIWTWLRRRLGRLPQAHAGDDEFQRPAVADGRAVIRVWRGIPPLRVAGSRGNAIEHAHRIPHRPAVVAVAAPEIHLKIDGMVEIPIAAGETEPALVERRDGRRGAAHRRNVACLRGMNMVDHGLVQRRVRYRPGSDASASRRKTAAIRMGAAGSAGIQIAVAGRVLPPSTPGVDVPEPRPAHHQLIVHYRIHAAMPIDRAKGCLRAHAATNGAEIRRAGEVLMHPRKDAGDASRDVRHPSGGGGGTREPAPAGKAGFPAHHHHLRVACALDLPRQRVHEVRATRARVQQNGLGTSLLGGEGEMPAHAVDDEGKPFLGTPTASALRHPTLLPIRTVRLAAIGHPVVAVCIGGGLGDVEGRGRSGFADLDVASKGADLCVNGAGQADRKRDARRPRQNHEAALPVDIRREHWPCAGPNASARRLKRAPKTPRAVSASPWRRSATIPRSRGWIRPSCGTRCR